MQQIQFVWPEGQSGALTTSWDDGTCHDRRLVATLRQHGLKGTWNLNSVRFDRDPVETAVQRDEAAALYAGHEIACHAYTHPHLHQIPEEAVLAELVADRRALEAVAGYPVRGMSLPYGAYDGHVLRILRTCGMLHSRTVRSHGGFALPEDFIEWHPTCHHKADLPVLWQKFRDNRDVQKLFFLWGHSYEFDRDGNWEIIENFARVAGAEPGIWHATNMEVVLYVHAWRNLWCALDMSSVRNPSGVTVWFRRDGEVHACAPGQVLRLA